MIDISLWEILLVVVIAILVIKPKQLPSLARNAGRWLRYLKNIYVNISSEVNKQLQIEADKEKEEKEQDHVTKE